MRHVTIFSSLAALAAVIALTGALAAPLAAQEPTATAAGTPAAAPNFTVGQLAPLGQPFEAIPGIEVEFNPLRHRLPDGHPRRHRPVR